MARPRVPRASTSASKGSALTPAQSRSINRAFDLAASSSSTRTAQTGTSSRTKKRSRTTIASSTEDEGEDKYDMVIGPSETSNSRNDATAKSGWQGGGGGFLPEGEEADQVNGETPTTGGGFIVEDNDRAASNSTISPYFGGGDSGGFKVEDREMVDAGGGGFLPEPEDVPPLGGGFVPDDNDEGIPELPDLPDLPSFANSNDTTLPPLKDSTSLIPLRSIPVAIASLSLPASEKDLMDLFSDVAVPNEEGVKCVARGRFVEVCEALMAGMNDEDEEEQPASDDEDDDDGDAYEHRDEFVKPRRRRSNRRSTRANYVQDDEPIAPLPDDFVLEDDDDDDDDDEESDCEDLNGSASKGKVTASANKSKGKGKTRTTKAEKPDPNRDLSQQEVEEALDTFELFFEGSVDKRLLKDRAIAMHDLERVARLLNENLPEDDIREMWDYAASTRGVVDLEAFARVLAQAL